MVGLVGAPHAIPFFSVLPFPGLRNIRKSVTATTTVSSSYKVILIEMIHLFNDIFFLNGAGKTVLSKKIYTSHL